MRRTSGRLCILSVLLLAASYRSAPSAQTPAPLAFEVASVKPNMTLGGDVQIRPEQFNAIAFPLGALITLAHGVSGAQMEGAPRWVTVERFDVRAITPRPSSRQEVLAMLRALLAERFQLKTHTETRETDGYALVVTRADRLGSGLHPVTVDCETNRLAEGSKPGLFPPEVRPACGRSVVQGLLAAGPVLTSNRYAAHTMEMLANTLWGSLGRPVIDRTGLTGRFDVELKYIIESAGIPGFSKPSATPPEGPSLRDALKEQLGLEVRSERVQVNLLVIDSIERPTPD